jgi:NAD(P)H-dependent FMN reductase
MTSPLRIGTILASVREGRRGEPFAHWIHSLASSRPGVEAELLDLKEWPLPSYGHKDMPTVAEKNYPAGSLPRRWADKVASMDAFIVVTPEYNHGYPGSLKNALDHLYGAWSYKPVGFVGYGGFAAGARAVEQLRLVALELRMAPVRDEVNLSLVGFTADAKGWPDNPIHQKKAAAMLDELLWWTRVVKDGREKNPR